MIHAFVDECQNYLTPSVKTIMVEARKFGLHLTLAQQTYGQDMDPGLQEAIIGNTAIKITGQGDSYTLKKMADRMRVNEDELHGLGLGEFFVKIIGSRPAFKLYTTTDLLDYRHSIGAGEWERVKQDQVNRYYRPIKPDRPGDGTATKKQSPRDDSFKDLEFV